MYVLPLCFGMGGLVMSVVLQLDGEFAETPGLFITGLLLGSALVCVGSSMLIKSRRLAKHRKNNE